MEAVSPSFAAPEPASWVLSCINPVGFSVTSWPVLSTLPKLASAGYTCRDWFGGTVAVLLTAELCPATESPMSFVHPAGILATISPRNAVATAVIPNYFSTRSRSRSNSSSAWDAVAKQQQHHPGHGHGAGSDDLLGLFGSPAPKTAPPPVPSVYSLGLTPTPMKSPLLPKSSAKSSVKPAAPPIGFGAAGAAGVMEWRVRLEVRCEAVRSMRAFTSSLAAWFAEFTTGKLTMLRHYSRAGNDACRTEWDGLDADGHEPGLFTMLGVGNVTLPVPNVAVGSASVSGTATTTASDSSNVAFPQRLPVHVVTPPQPPRRLSQTESHGAAAAHLDPFTSLFTSQPGPAAVAPPPVPSVLRKSSITAPPAPAPAASDWADLFGDLSHTSK